ncbi:MAG: hypothetical protein U0441_30080 [Polyangiaceae bacterium]
MARDRTIGSRGVVVAALATAFAVCAGTARAGDPSPSDKALAETLFQAGRKLISDGKVAEGCEKLESSQRLEPKTGTLLNLALCHEQLDKTASAWAEMIEVGSQAARLKQDDRVAFAKERVAALEKRLSRVTITTRRKEPNAVILLDGKPLDPSALGLAVPMDPGLHAIDATIQGKEVYHITVKVAPGPASQTVELPELSLTGPVETAAPTASSAPTATGSAPVGTGSAPVATAMQTGTAGPSAPPPSGGGGLFVGGIVATSAGVIGLAVGGVFGGLAFSKEGEANKICPDKTCPDQAGVDMHKEANGLATISTVGFAAGIAVAGAGLTMLLLSRSSDPKKTGARPWLTPVATPSSAGFAAGGSF